MNTEAEPGTDAAAAAVDQVLHRAGMRPSPEDRERLIRMYPKLAEIAALVRRIPVDDAEPAVLFAATDPDQDPHPA